MDLEGVFQIIVSQEEVSLADFQAVSQGDSVGTKRQEKDTFHTNVPKYYQKKKNNSLFFLDIIKYRKNCYFPIKPK